MVKAKKRQLLPGRLAVLFGAGASYGAGGVTPYPPPLGNRLFDQLEIHCPRSWGKLPDEYKQGLRDDFEAGMERLWNTPSLAPNHLFIDMGLYFTRFEPPADGRDCYSQFVTALRTRKLVRRTVIASLNYELILDIATSQAGLTMANGLFDGKPPLRDLVVLKPHGACNLLPDMQVIGGTFILAGEKSGFYDGKIDVVTSLPEVQQRYARGLSLPPVMSMYTRDKHSPVGATFIERTRALWREWVRSCSAVLCVGARPVMWDEHIWRPIIERNATTWFIGGQDESYRALAAELRRLEYLGATFDASLQEVFARLDRFI